MMNNPVQEKLCTEPKETHAQAIQVAIAFEDHLKRQKSYGYKIQESRLKDEPVCSVNSTNSNTREYWRCEAGKFTPDHLK